MGYLSTNALMLIVIGWKKYVVFKDLEYLMMYDFVDTLANLRLEQHCLLEVAPKNHLMSI